MDTDKFLRLIDITLKAADDFVNTDYGGNEKPMLNTKKALLLLKEEVHLNPENINERVLRAMHDVGGVSVKAYYNSPLEDAISNLTELLYNEIPSYKYLQPLRIDYGKGNPI